MSIVLYYHSPDPGGQDLYPSAEYFTDQELLKALGRAETLRGLGKTHVSISSEMGDSIGKPGVTAVIDGKTPDGETYEWSKAHRAGKSRR